MSIETDNKRQPIHQLLDYRVFIVSCYHNSEVSDELRAAMNSQGLIEEQTESGNYIFFKYGIDDYVISISINRSIDGNPATLSLRLFPDFDSKRNQFRFMYNLNDSLTPVFRRMDYVEVQVADDTTVLGWTKKVKTPKVTPLRDVLNHSANGQDYTDATLPYKIRFKGYVHSITESDSAENGLEISLQAASMLYYLANTPFVSSFALFAPAKRQLSEIRILSDNYINIYGDLLHDLRDSVERTRLLFENTFQVSARDRVDYTTLLPTVAVDGTTVGINVSPMFKVSTTKPHTWYYSADPFNPVSQVSKLKKDLDIGEVGFPLADSSQTGLIMLIEFYIGLSNNSIASKEIFRLFKSELFDQEITFSGTNAGFINEYVQMLAVLNEWKNNLKYVLYEQADGTIIYDRPRFDNPINYAIYDQAYLSYDFNESSNGIVTDVYVTPGYAIGIMKDDMKQVLVTNSGSGLDQLRRYGYKRSPTISNPNISNDAAREAFAKTEKAVNNAQLSSLTVVVPYNSEYDISSILWFNRKNLAGLTRSITEKITYGGSATTEVNLSYLRRVITNTDLINSYSDRVSIFTDPDYDIVRRIIIMPFPEYTFTSDFYSGKVKVTDKSNNPVSDREREILV